MISRWKKALAGWLGFAPRHGADDEGAMAPMPEPPRSRPDPLASLRHPGFRLFVIASLLSNTGNQMRTLAVGWEVYQRTKQPLSLGLIGLVLALPVLLLAMPAGVAADRFSRKALIMLSQMGLAACGLGLAWASYTSAPLAITYLLLLGTGTCRAVGWPATTAIVTQLVPAPVFPNAATWRSMAFQLAATVGPLLGGALLAVTNSVVVYLADASSSLILVACLAVIKPGPQARSNGLRSWENLLDGARFVARQPLILSTITLDMVAVLFGGATALLPVYAADILQVGETGFGWLRAMPSIGAIAMGLLLTMRHPINRAGRTLMASVVTFGVATIVFGLSRSYLLSLAALLVLGAADNVSVVIRATLLQLLTPDSLRGRVAAVNAIFINTSNEIGEFESGVAAHLLSDLVAAFHSANAKVLGTILAVAGGGVMTLVTVATVAAIWPKLLYLGRLEELQPCDSDIVSE